MLVSGTFNSAIGAFNLEPDPLVPAGKDKVRGHTELLVQQWASYFGRDTTRGTRGGFKLLEAV